MSKRRKGGEYAVHVLGTETEPEVVKGFGRDGMKASIFYFRNGILAQRRSIFFFDGALPGMEKEVIDSYVPPEGAPVHRGALMVTLGDPEPAFPRETAMRAEAAGVAPVNQREKADREDADETDVERNLREERDDRRHAAQWYAKGVIDGLGALSPFTRDDANEFADWHVETSFGDAGFYPIPAQWKTWSERRREETGK